ncbi:hypothetical protein EfsSVR2331_02200 [Enterococcus faecalis]|nr:hypothetical protein EfsSVR2331_02200 [Enterococcus faecalis]
MSLKKQVAHALIDKDWESTRTGTSNGYFDGISSRYFIRKS